MAEPLKEKNSPSDAPCERVIRPSPLAYLGLGAIVLAIVALWTAVWISRGAQTGAWQPIAIVVGVYLVWCAVIARRTVCVLPDGLRLNFLVAKTVWVRFDDVHESIVTYWLDRRPMQIIVYSDGQAPIASIALQLYRAGDRDFLLSIPGLRVT